MSQQQLHRIVVVGGGAGGLELVTQLGDKLGRTGKAQIILVDRNQTHIWKPLLHEVAAGSLDPNSQQLDYAAQALWHGFEFHCGELIGLNRAQKVITIGPFLSDTGEALLPERELAYDILVLALGSKTHFFGVPGAEENTIALDTVQQAERFRRALMAVCMKTQTALDKGAGHPQVNLAIIGAGATGVELSAELRNTARILGAYGLHKLDGFHDINITLIEAGPRILPALPEKLSSTTQKLLNELGIQVSTSDPVAEIKPNLILTKSGREMPFDLAVWAAGIKAPPVLAELDGLAVNRIAQIEVNASLQSKSDVNIFALGDCAACVWPEKNTQVPPRAQAAHQQASFLYKAILCRLEGKPLAIFHYRDFGSLVSLGDYSAVGSLMGGLISRSMFIEGVFARLMYISLYRMHFMALHGVMRTVLDVLAQRLRKSTLPKVKLH
ncbi:NAD(P)/FAD-dependent oxidoreductase [Ampullimonas aquatilis]|uniref:NAD(P)/FAD-dependent oxidoreductase n=1 Tax=Ampullimonas aquatilis TaxID=1341549 RepID=UPI003C70C3F4